MSIDFPEIDPPGSRICDMPHDQRPREKLARLGPAALDNAELMALFISTGTKGRSAIDIGRELIGKKASGWPRHRNWRPPSSSAPVWPANKCRTLRCIRLS